MAQAVASSTDELLSQLAASEIDRLLAEADNDPANESPNSAFPSNASPGRKSPSEEAAAAPSSPNTAASSASLATSDGNERAALLQAAGFDSAAAPSPSNAVPTASAAKEIPPVDDERSAVLHAAGFEEPLEMDFGRKAPEETHDEQPGAPLPVFLKPLVWINAPLESCPTIVRQMLGKVGVVTLLNALAVLTYVFFFRKH